MVCFLVASVGAPSHRNNWISLQSNPNPTPWTRQDEYCHRAAANTSPANCGALGATFPTPPSSQTVWSSATALEEGPDIYVPGPWLMAASVWFWKQLLIKQKSPAEQTKKNLFFPIFAHTVTCLGWNRTVLLDKSLLGKFQQRMHWFGLHLHWCSQGLKAYRSWEVVWTGRENAFLKWFTGK